jgi:urease accessory protein
VGRAHVDDPDTERPPDVAGLPVLDRVVDGAPEGGGAGRDPLPELRLPFELRARSRLRARLDDGREVGLVLPRGTVLRGGAIVEGGGLRVRVRSADEDVIEARAADAQALARAAYHLGNRHVPVQVRGDALVFGYDPVLVDMLVRMGVATRRTWAPFEPEGGAYGAHGGHGHSH